MLKIGHRGAMGYEPENSMKAFKKAIELKVDMIELDLRKCKSGELVVIHDYKLKGKYKRRKVSDFTLKELQKIYSGKNEHVLKLEEALDCVKRKAKINIELKSQNIAKRLMKIIDTYVENYKWKYSDFLISSYNHVELNKIKKINPKLKLGLIICGIPVSKAKFAENFGAHAIHLDYEFINKGFITDAHKRNIKVIVYTVDDPQDIKKMKRWGVDGIISDYPDRI